MSSKCFTVLITHISLGGGWCLTLCAPEHTGVQVVSQLSGHAPSKVQLGLQSRPFLPDLPPGTWPPAAPHSGPAVGAASRPQHLTS